MNHYSERDEQPFILEFFKDKADGYFVDIGANNGWKGSNTHALALLDWSGVCVEAAPDTFRHLQSTYGSNPKVACFHAAVWNKVGDIDFLIHNEVDDSGLSRVGSDQTHSMTKITVPCVTLDAVMLNAPRAVDFLTVDAEGCDYDIFAAYSFDKKPALIMTEYAPTKLVSDFQALFEPHGYKLVFSNVANAAFTLI